MYVNVNKARIKARVGSSALNNDEVTLVIRNGSQVGPLDQRVNYLTGIPLGLNLLQGTVSLENSQGKTVLPLSDLVSVVTGPLVEGKDFIGYDAMLQMGFDLGGIVSRGPVKQYFDSREVIDMSQKGRNHQLRNILVPDSTIQCAQNNRIPLAMYMLGRGLARRLHFEDGVGWSKVVGPRFETEVPQRVHDFL